MKRIIETIGLLFFIAGASAMDSTRVAIPTIMAIGGISVIFIIERRLNNG